MTTPRPRILSCLALTVVASACGCVLTDAETPKAFAEAPAPAPEAAPSPWEKQLTSRLSNDPAGYSQGWALFSTGGWADAGQVIVLGNPEKKLYHLYHATPGATDITSQRALSAANFQAKLGGLLPTADTLADVAPVAFDALTFYYVHAVKQPHGDVSIVKRLTIRDIGKAKVPEHRALIAAFQSLSP